MNVLLLLLSFAVFGVAVVTCTGCQYKRLPKTIIRDNYRTANISASSLLNCVTSQCRCSEGCAASFHSPSGQCLAVSPRLYALSLKMHVSFYAATDDADWSTIIRTGDTIQTDGPAALWLLDNEARGRNLGTKDKRINMDETGLSWTFAGPSQADADQKFVTMTTSNRAFVQNQYDGKFVLEMTKAVTLTLWVKTPRTPDELMVIFRDPHTSNAFSVLFAKYDNFPYEQASIQLHLVPGKQYFITEKNFKNQHKWRHMAVVYRGANQVQFYMDGSDWPMAARRYEAATIENPRKIFIGRADGAWYLKGGMACLCVFERALTKEEINRVMNSCP